MSSAGSIEVAIKATGSAQFIAKVQHAIDKLNGLNGASGSAATGVGKVGDAMGRFATLATAAAAAATAVGAAAVIKMGTMASDFNEMSNVMTQAFGKDRVAEVETWAASTAETMGRSTQAVRSYAGGLQAMLSSMMGSSAVAEPMSKSFAKLAIDLGSFWNVADNDALNKLRSGLAGEAEPLKAFGVVMNQASLEAYALANGIKVSVKDMTEAEKVTLRYNFILDKTAQAHGDAVRTGDGFANTIKRVEGEVINMSTAIGQQALPFMQDLLEVFSKMLAVMKGSDWTETFRTISSLIKEAADWALTLGLALGKSIQFGHEIQLGFMPLGKDAKNQLRKELNVESDAWMKDLAGMQDVLRGNEPAPVKKHLFDVGADGSYGEISPQEKFNRDMAASKAAREAERSTSLGSITGAPGQGVHKPTKTDMSGFLEEQHKLDQIKMDLEQNAFDVFKKMQEKKIKFHDEELAAAAELSQRITARSTAFAASSFGSQVAGLSAMRNKDTGELEAGAIGLGGTDSAKGLGQSIDSMISGGATAGAVKGALVNGFGVVMEQAAGPVTDIIGGGMGKAMGALMGFAGATAGMFTQIAGQVVGAAVEAFQMAFTAIGDAWKQTGGKILGEVMGNSPMTQAAQQVIPVFGALIAGLAGLTFIVGVLAAPLGSIAMVLTVLAAAAFPLLGALMLALSPLVITVAALAAGLIILTAGVAAIGMAFFMLATKTKSFERFQKAIEAVSDRLIKAVEPFFQHLMPLVGILDAVVSVIIPMAAAFANVETVSRVLFEVIKFLAVVFSAVVIAVAIFQTVVLAAVIGVVGAITLLVKSFDFAANGIAAFNNAILGAGAAMLSGISAAFNGVLPQSMKDMLGAAAGALTGSMSTLIVETDTRGLDALSEAAGAMSPDLAAMGTALAHLTGLTYNEAKTRAGILSKEKAMNESLTNVPQGFKVIAARMRAIQADSYGTGALPGEDAGGGGGNNFIIDKLQVMANDTGEFMSEMMQQSERRTFQQTGTTGSRDGQNTGG